MSNERRTLQDSYVPASVVLLVDAPVLVLLMFLVFLLAKCYSSSATASTLCLSRLKLWTNGSSAQWFKQRNLCCPKKGNNLEGVQTVVKSCAYPSSYKSRCTLLYILYWMIKRVNSWRRLQRCVIHFTSCHVFSFPSPALDRLRRSKVARNTPNTRGEKKGQIKWSKPKHVKSAVPPWCLSFIHIYPLVI